MRSLPTTAASATPCGRPVRAITPRPACTAPAPAGTHGAPMCRICRAWRAPTRSSTTTSCAGSSEKTIPIKSITTAAPASPTSAPTPPTRIWAAFVQYNTFVSNGRSYRYIGQFVSSRYCFDFGADESGTPCMTYYGFGHGVGMSQCGAVGYAQEQGHGLPGDPEPLLHGCEHFHFRQLRRWVLWLAAQPVPLVSSGKLQRNARKTFSNHAGFGIL